ncbi:MAG: hypothetical protein ABII23_01375 [bacterium]
MKVTINKQVYESEEGGKVFYKRLTPLRANEILIKYTDYSRDSEYFGQVHPQRMPAFAREVLMNDGVIIGWEGFTDENDKPIEFKQENAELLPIKNIYELVFLITRLDEAQPDNNTDTDVGRKKMRGRKSMP